MQSAKSIESTKSTAQTLTNIAAIMNLNPKAAIFRMPDFGSCPSTPESISPTGSTRYVPYSGSSASSDIVTTADLMPVAGSYVYLYFITFGSLTFYPRKFFKARPIPTPTYSMYDVLAQTYDWRGPYSLPSVSGVSVHTPQMEYSDFGSACGSVVNSSASSVSTDLDSIWDSGFSRAGTACTTPVTSPTVFVEELTPASSID